MGKKILRDNHNDSIDDEDDDVDIDEGIEEDGIDDQGSDEDDQMHEDNDDFDDSEEGDGEEDNGLIEEEGELNEDEHFDGGVDGGSDHKSLEGSIGEYEEMNREKDVGDEKEDIKRKLKEAKDSNGNYRPSLQERRQKLLRQRLTFIKCKERRLILLDK